MTGSKSYRAPVLADVAQAAGVSVPTVSRVLNGWTNVSPELSQRVHEAVETLGYRPNSAARSLRSSKRTLVSVLAGATGNYGYARTLEGIESAARRAGMSVSITVVESADAAHVRRAVDLTLAQPTAGAIALEFDRAGIGAVKALPAGVPLVVAGGGAGRDDGVSAALLDERAAGGQATRYLLRLGHRTVHHIGGPDEGKPSGRTEGWREALAAAGAPVPEPMRAEWDALSGYRCGERLAGREDVTAVLCANDEIAIGVMRALTDRGLRVPEDVSVIGFDDQPLMALWRPSLTTVDQDFEDLGSRAFDLLSRLIDGDDGPLVSVVAPQLVVRESTAPPRRD